MDVLASPPPDTGGNDPGDWLTGLMVALAGRLRLEEAAAAIEEALGLEDDDEGSAEVALERGFRVGRNEPCPCGSGKKYKRCCLRQSGG